MGMFDIESHQIDLSAPYESTLTSRTESNRLLETVFAIYDSQVFDGVSVLVLSNTVVIDFRFCLIS
jgi:hypothetical protein